MQFKNYLILLLIWFFADVQSFMKLSIDEMLRPMCEARCLDIFMKMTVNSSYTTKTTTNGDRIVSYKAKNIEEKCSTNFICAGCMIACDVVKSSVDKCLSNCTLKKSSNRNSRKDNRQKQQSCTDSCHFIETNRQNRPGTCPDSNDNNHGDLLYTNKCSYECSQDSECFKIGTKCCLRSRCDNRKVCQLAIAETTNAPPVPKGIVVKQITDTNSKSQSTNDISLDLDWSSYPLHEVNYPIVFEVQFRSGPINYSGNTVQGSWTHVLSTPKTGLILSALNLEASYQFRVIAFSQHGYRGDGYTTPPITIDYQPTKLPVPINITEKMTRIDNEIDKGSVPQISVSITWSLDQVKSLIPVTFFKLSWRKFQPDNENDPLVKVYNIFTPGSQFYYTIKNLESSTTYKVTIQSTIEYRNKRYNSSESVYFITTVPFPSKSLLESNIQNGESVIKNRNNQESQHCYCKGLHNNTPIKIGKFEYKNEKLSTFLTIQDLNTISKLLPNDMKPSPQKMPIFHISWYPIACIESKPFIDDLNKIMQSSFSSLTTGINQKHILQNLQFRCNYRIDIKMSYPHSSTSQTVSWSSCFCTPNCPDQINQPSSASSTTKNPCVKLNQLVPPQPFNVRAHLNQSSTRIVTNQNQVSIEWAIDTASINPSPLTFRVTWAPRIEEPLHESMYSQDLVPLMDMTRSLCKIIQFPQQSIVLSDLTPELIYVVKIETIHQKTTSSPTSIYFKLPSSNKLDSYNSSVSSIYHIHIILISYVILIVLFQNLR